LNFRKAIKISLVIATIAIIAFVLLFYRPVALAGDTLYEPVYTGSMEPAIPVGSVVVIKAVDPDTLRVGDVITFRVLEPPSITHRIVNVTDEGFITRGDANNGPDVWVVKKENVVGKVEMTIPFIGYLGFFVKTPIGFTALIIIPAGAIIVFELRKILAENRNKKEQ
jgi:signal peptidase